MRIPVVRFNFYLLAALAVAVACGCQSSKPKGPRANLRLHIEAPPDTSPSARTTEVPIYREHPITVTVAKDPVLDERRVEEASVVDVMGGFALRIQFDTRGTWVLEQCTMASRGRHCAVFCAFGEAMFTNRWLAAP